jgi:LacI family transcriptional regulator
MVLGIEQGLHRAAYRPMIATTHWAVEYQQDEAHSLRLLLERRVDGVIVLAGRIPDDELHAVAAQVPMVIVARRVEGLEARCICVDNQAGAYRATRYLIGLGHTCIAHIAGPADHPDATRRLAGYQQALVEAGLAVDQRLIVEGQFTEASGLAGVEELLGRGERFSAVFAANDQTAYGAMLGLFNHGYRIPTDISLVGFDDQHISAYTLPPLTTVRQPVVEMGQAAAVAVLRLLDGAEPLLPEFPTDLVIRKSAVRLRPGE